jgi:hypothetical protein
MIDKSVPMVCKTGENEQGFQLYEFAVIRRKRHPGRFASLITACVSRPADWQRLAATLVHEAG